MTRLSVEERFWSKVNKTDACWLWTKAKDGSGYGAFRIGNKQYSSHRVLYQWVVGAIPEGFVLDHTCHNRACVRPDHLRLVTNKQNCEHRLGAQANSKSGVRGVCWNKQSKKWVAQLKHHGQMIYVGKFDTVEAASYAVTQKRNELFTHNDFDRTDHNEPRRAG